MKKFRSWVTADEKQIVRKETTEMKKFRSWVTADEKQIVVLGPGDFPDLWVDCDDVTEEEDKVLKKEVKKLLKILEEHWEQ